MLYTVYTTFQKFGVIKIFSVLKEGFFLLSRPAFIWSEIQSNL